MKPQNEFQLKQVENEFQLRDSQDRLILSSALKEVVLQKAKTLIDEGASIYGHTHLLNNLPSSNDCKM